MRHHITPTQDRTLTREKVRVMGGQVWRSLDARRPARDITVISVAGAFARYLDDRHRWHRVAIRRMHHHCRGWELVSP